MMRTTLKTKWQRAWFIWLGVVWVWGAWAVPASAQIFERAEDEDRTMIYRITLHSQSPEPPVMRYQLLPSWKETRDANAAPQYHRAILIISQTMSQVTEKQELWEQLDSWRTMPLDQLPQEEVQRKVGMFSNALQEVHFGARRRYCRWDLPIEEQRQDLFAILLPEIQEMRSIARILAVRIRLQLARGNLDEAMTDLQTGYAMARHVGQDNFLVSSLVGLAVASVMHEQLLTALSLESAPNLYWSLTRLPNPLIDIHGSLEVEWDSVFIVLPELLEARIETYPEDVWNERLHSVSERMRPYLQQGDSIQRVLGPVKLFSHLDIIRNVLVERMGYARDDVEAMPASRAILLYSGLAFERLRDDSYRAARLPYHQAVRFYQADQEQREQAQPSIDPLRLGEMFSPAAQALHRSMTVGQRFIELLRAVEAIRDFAQSHDRLPESLEEIEALPVPINPVSGEPFVYRLHDDQPSRFTLETRDSAAGNQVRVIVDMQIKN
jgi:hypothetical protein